MTKTISTRKVLESLVNQAYMDYAIIYKNRERISEKDCDISAIMICSAINAIEEVIKSLGIENEYREVLETCFGSEFSKVCEAKEEVEIEIFCSLR